MDEPAPHTVSSLTADLRALGVRDGDVVLLHSAQRSLGFVAGGDLGRPPQRRGR